LSIKNTTQATGTGTDNIITVTGTSRPRVSYTGGHSKIGELIGKAVYEAVVDALKKQNGFKMLKPN
jgi:adenosylcobinamide hydrolase